MAFSAVTESDFLTLTTNFEFLVASGQAIAIQLNSRETGTLMFNIDAAGTTDNVEVEIVQGQRVSNGNGLAGATSASDVELNAADGFTTDDEKNGLYYVQTSGDEAGEGRLIVDSVASDNGVVLSHALSGTPSAAETYALYRADATRITYDMSTVISQNNKHSFGVGIDARLGEFVLVAGRATGGTNSHRIQVSFQTDGGPPF